MKHQLNQAIWLITFIILLLSLSGVPLVRVAETITTIAGDGTDGYAGDGKDAAKDGRVNQPLDIFADAKGNLYVADTANHLIRRLDSGNIITTIAGTGGPPGFSGDDGLATAALLNFPASVVVDSQGNIYLVTTLRVVMQWGRSASSAVSWRFTRGSSFRSLDTERPGGITTRSVVTR